MTTKYIRARRTSGATTAFVPLLDIPDGHGELKSVGVANGLQYHAFRITIDGTELVDERLAGTANANSRCNMSLSIGLRFEDSLLVEARGDVLSPQTAYWAVATTDSSQFVSSNIFDQDFGEATFAFERATYRRENGGLFQVISPIGPSRTSVVSLSLDVYRASETLEGSVALRSASGEPLSEGYVPLVTRISGTQRAFEIVTERGERRGFGVEGVNGVATFELSAIDVVNSFRPGIPFVLGVGPLFEIAALLPGYANEPGAFQVI